MTETEAGSGTLLNNQQLDLTENASPESSSVTVQVTCRFLGFAAATMEADQFCGH